MLSRRDLVKVATVASTVAAATGVSACSPSSEAVSIPQNFFGLIASRKFDLAREKAAKNVKLVLSAKGDLEVFSGPQDVINELSNIFHSAGWRMIGDNEKSAPGGFWSGFGGWNLSDLVPKNTLDLSMMGCGDRDMADPVLNVYVRATDSLVEQIFLLESYSLSYTRDPAAPPPPVGGY